MSSQTDKEATFKSMADSAPVLMWISDVTKACVWFNKAWLDFVGRPMNQETGDGWTEGIHPEDLQQTLHIYNSHFDEKRSFTMEYRLRRNDGAYRWVLDNGVPHFDPKGKFTGYIGSSVDIHDLKTAQTQLSQTHARLELAVDAAELGTFYCPMPMREIIWNAKCKEHFFLPPEAEITFDTFYAIIHPADRERVRLAVERAVFDGADYDIEYRTVSEDGRVRWIRAKGRAYNDELGKPSRFDGITIDITEHKQAEETRIRLFETEQFARAEAERANMLKDQFLATLSHELRTPLQSILGWVDLLSSGDNSPEELYEGLSIIGRNARTQARIVEDLLDMSRILSGKLRLDVQEVDISQVIQASVDALKPAAQAKNITVQTWIEADTPRILGDPNRLQQVLWNLLSNAVKFTPTGKWVEISVERANAHLEINVRDSGEGICPEFLPHVFERFRQGDATVTRKQGGLGLGLAIVKNLVELHGGTVTAKSRGLMRGATFTIAVPIVEKSTDTSRDTSPSHQDSETIHMLSPARWSGLETVNVLVVDDEEDARNTVAQILRKAGAQVALAEGASEALELIKGNPPDVLVSDIGMPGKDGYSLIRAVRDLADTDGGGLPALALSAYARADDRIKAVSAGFNVHLAKPVDSRELITLVRSLSRKRKKD